MPRSSLKTPTKEPASPHEDWEDHENSDKEQESCSSTSTIARSIDFDVYAPRCFMMREVNEVTDVKIKTDDADVKVFKKVFNAVMVDPFGNERVLAIWNNNALKAAAFFK